MSFKEKLFEGKYNYLDGDKVYTQENFVISKEDKVQGNYEYQVEVLSRVKTGEFLKIFVEAEFNNAFDPLHYKIVRSLGHKESTEIFHVNQKDKIYNYTFIGDGGTHYYDKVVNGKPYIASPCFSLSTVMINAKKLDPVHRTVYSVITSNNIWEYEAPFTEKDIYMELQDLDQVPLDIGGKELSATHCRIVYLDDKGHILDHQDDIYLSKYNFLPYKAVFANGLKIEVEALKNYDQNRVKF